MLVYSNTHNASLKLLDIYMALMDTAVKQYSVKQKEEDLHLDGNKKKKKGIA